MVIHKYLVLREGRKGRKGRKGRDSPHASRAPLVVLGQPLCNLLWRETSKTTARAYRPRMILLQTAHKIVK